MVKNIPNKTDSIFPISSPCIQTIEHETTLYIQLLFWSLTSHFYKPTDLQRVLQFQKIDDFLLIDQEYVNLMKQNNLISKNNVHLFYIRCILLMMLITQK